MSAVPVGIALRVDRIPDRRHQQNAEGGAGLTTSAPLRVCLVIHNAPPGCCRVVVWPANQQLG